LFVEKLNKKQEGFYVIEEDKDIQDGKWEGYLEHDNVNRESIVIYTGPNFTGTKVDNFFISTPSETPWKTHLKVFSNSEKIYINYESQGDQVEAEDINQVQNALADTVENLNDYKAATDASINDLEIRTTNLEETAVDHISDGASHSKTARFVVGTSTSGWTEKDCDYLCDGTNDQEEIIQALNDLPATGGEVVILDGIYNITASINIPKDNVSLRGNGNATILKRMYNSTDTNSGPTAKGLITLNEKSGCKIQGLQIDGNKATYTASYNYGICLYSSSDNTVTSNTCNNSNNGIRFDSSSNNNTITGNTCNSNSNGIRLDSSSNNTITGNICNNNSSNGIYLSSSSNSIVIGNTCNNNYYGIFLYSSSDNTITGNICNNSNNGIRLYLSSNNNTITGNTCNNNSNGICLYSSSDNMVTGNTCIRGIGTPEDYTTNQHTILLSGTGNNYNLISSNNCMGKAPVVEGGTGNTVFNNKWNESSDFEDLRADVVAHKADAVKHITSAERTAWDNKAEVSQIPTKVSHLENDRGYVTQEELGDAGYGDMIKSIYDTDNDGKVDAAEAADSVPWTGVTGKPSTFPPSSHTHIISNITGLQVALDGKMSVGPLTWNDLKGV